MCMWSRIKQEVKLSGMVCPFEGFKSMGVEVIKTQEVWYPFSQILSQRNRFSGYVTKAIIVPPIN